MLTALTLLLFAAPLPQEGRYARFEKDFLPVGQPAPAVVFKNLDGTELSLASLRGKAVLLNFWFYN